MNSIQKTYMLAKADYDLMDQELRAVETKYIAEKGIVNKDGSIPIASWVIEDDTVASLAMDECTNIKIESGLWEKHCKARKGLNKAESELIKYGLSFIPEEDRKTLEKEVETDLSVRNRVICLVFRMDSRTVESFKQLM